MYYMRSRAWFGIMYTWNLTAILPQYATQHTDEVKLHRDVKQSYEEVPAGATGPGRAAAGAFPGTNSQVYFCYK